MKYCFSYQNQCKKSKIIFVVKIRLNLIKKIDFWSSVISFSVEQLNTIMNRFGNKLYFIMTLPEQSWYN